MTNDIRSSSNQVQPDLEAEMKPHVGDTNINGRVMDASEPSLSNVGDKQLQDMLAWAHEYSLSQGLDEDTLEHLEQFVKASKEEQLVMLYVKLLVIEATIS